MAAALLSRVRLRRAGRVAGHGGIDESSGIGEILPNQGSVRDGSNFRVITNQPDELADFVEGGGWTEDHFAPLLLLLFA
jgi:hypothetical protein